MRKQIIVCIFLLISNFVYSQDCPIGDITFNTQEELDSFIIQYPNCTHLNGSVSVTSYIGSPYIDNLKGLKNIHSISGNLSLRRLDSLKNLMDLEQIQYVGGIYLYEIAPDFSLKGLEKLDTIGSIRLGYDLEGGTPGNPLASFEGLDNITTIDGDLIISYTSRLDFQNLKKLKTITGFLYIGYNVFPNDFKGLDSLESVGKDFILETIEVETISNFSSLKSIGGILRLLDVNKLESLDGLENIDYKTITNLEIKGRNMSFCGVKSVCDYLQTGGIADIQYNNTGCRNVEEILASCTTTSNKEWLLSQSTKIYPNPVQQKISVVFPITLKGQYSLSNHLGQVVFKGVLQPNLTHDFTGYPKGIYFFTVETERYYFTHKVIYQ